MATGKINKRALDALDPGVKDTYIWDAMVKGFALKVTPKRKLIPGPFTTLPPVGSERVAHGHTSRPLSFIKPSSSLSSRSFWARRFLLIDIHHLHPVAEGERKTTLEDLIPLCPTCHKQAHSQRPSMPIEELREWARENKP